MLFRKPPQFWYQKNIISHLLLPFAFLFRAIVSVRKFYYLHIYKRINFNVPIIIVGNLTVGGSGKTPVVIWLAELLKQNGYNPGIVSRGYGGKAKEPMMVTTDGDPNLAGDEAVLIAKRTQCPVVVARNRVLAVKKLLSDYEKCNVVISDDGLQHYALHRDIEIIVIDQTRGFGNSFCLPAGPLREPLSRLSTVNFVIDKEKKLIFGKLINIKNPGLIKEINEFIDEEVYVVAGIGNPENFFNTLKNLGLTFKKHAFPDHYKYKEQDFSGINLPIIMTEKDAVKCTAFANENFWYLPVSIVLPKSFEEQVLKKLKSNLRY